MKQIVCLATSPWYPIPTRKQQVMSRMPDAEILYFDPSATIIGEKVRDNITVYRLPPVLPFFYKCRAINRINQKRIARFVCEKMKEHGFNCLRKHMKLEAERWYYHCDRLGMLV